MYIARRIEAKCCLVPQDVSGDGFPVACLPFGVSPTRPGATISEESGAAETSREGFSIRSRQMEPDSLKRKFSATGPMQAPEQPRSATHCCM